MLPSSILKCKESTKTISTRDSLGQASMQAPDSAFPLNLVAYFGLVFSSVFPFQDSDCFRSSKIFHLHRIRLRRFISIFFDTISRWNSMEIVIAGPCPKQRMPTCPRLTMRRCKVNLGPDPCPRPTKLKPTIPHPSLMRLNVFIVSRTLILPALLQDQECPLVQVKRMRRWRRNRPISSHRTLTNPHHQQQRSRHATRSTQAHFLPRMCWEY